MLTEFAERFLRLRQDQGYTQQKIAEKLGVTSQAVSKWENGTSLPDTEMIRSIARLMDCSTDYLLNHQASAISQSNLESPWRGYFPLSHNNIGDIPSHSGRPPLCREAVSGILYPPRRSAS